MKYRFESGDHKSSSSHQKMLQHSSSSSSSMNTATGSSSNRQHRNDRGDRNIPTERPFPIGAAQRVSSSNSNGPMPSRGSSSSNMPTMRPQSSQQQQQQPQQPRHTSSGSSSSSKTDQRHLTKEHKSHPDKNLAMKHPPSKQQHFSGSR